jgi:hypothetical protein
LAGSNNFQIWNPSSVNQDTDAQYTTDTLRTGGAPVGGLLPSKTDNKFRYQLSVGMYALMQMLANKNFNVSDANVSTLTGVLANILTTADLKLPLLSVAWSPTLVFDCSRATGFQCTLLGDVTSLSFINVTAGQLITAAFVQGGSGGYTVTFPIAVRGPGVVVGTVGWTSEQAYFVTSDLNLRAVAPMTASN